MIFDVHEMLSADTEAVLDELEAQGQLDLYRNFHAVDLRNVISLKDFADWQEVKSFSSTTNSPDKLYQIYELVTPFH